MSDSAQKGRTFEQKGPKIEVFPTEEINYKIDRLAGDVGTPEANSCNQKAVEHQQIHDNKGENEQNEESDCFVRFLRIG